jgi:hypothetical protein
MKRGFSTGFMAIYWIALPFAGLATVGLAWLLLAPNASLAETGAFVLWFPFAASVAMTVLIVWRLRVHGRARRLANAQAALAMGPAPDPATPGSATPD